MKNIKTAGLSVVLLAFVFALVGCGPNVTVDQSSPEAVGRTFAAASTEADEKALEAIVGSKDKGWVKRELDRQNADYLAKDPVQFVSAEVIDFDGMKINVVNLKHEGIDLQLEVKEEGGKWIVVLP